MATETKVTYWHGIDAATDQYHDECYRRYVSGSPNLASYHFEVAADLSAVRIIDAREGGANGIWTLAEIRASGESWPIVTAVAAKMLAAIAKATGQES